MLFLTGKPAIFGEFLEVFVSREISKNTGIMIALALSIFISMGAGNLYAGVSAQPDSTELVVRTGEPTPGAIQVRNDSPETVHVKVEPEDWLKWRAKRDVMPVGKWLTVSPLEFDLEPKETKQVDYTINVPNNDEPELVAMVFFGTTAPNGAFNITNRYGVSIYAALSDKLSLECSIAGVTIDRNIITTEAGKTDNGLVFLIDVVNGGSVHLRPIGDIVITDEEGAKYHAPIVRDFPVYPGNHFIQRVFWNNKDIKPGRYEADIYLDYGKLYSIDKVIEKKISFMVNPDGSVE